MKILLAFIAGWVTSAVLAAFASDDEDKVVLNWIGEEEGPWPYS